MLYYEDEIMILYRVMPDGTVKFYDATHSLRLNHPDNHKEYKRKLGLAMEKIKAEHAST